MEYHQPVTSPLTYVAEAFNQPCALFKRIESLSGSQKIDSPSKLNGYETVSLLRTSKNMVDAAKNDHSNEQA